MVSSVRTCGGLHSLTVKPHVHTDNRNIPALQRIGDPDDIIASVRVENGEASVAATRRDVVTD